MYTASVKSENQKRPRLSFLKWAILHPSVGDGAHIQVHTRIHTHTHTHTHTHSDLASPWSSHTGPHSHTHTHTHTHTLWPRGVVGCSFAPGLPGVLSHGDEMLSLFNSHLALSTFCDPLFAECTREKTGEEVTEARTLAWAFHELESKEESCTTPNVHSCSTWNRSGFLISSLGYRSPPPTLELQVRTWFFTCLFGTPEYQNDAL